MYGTVARVRVKPGMEARFLEYGNQIDTDPPPGHVRGYVYQMDRNSREYFLVVMFESREAYRANAESPEQHQQFLQMMEMLEAEPEWNDGEVVQSF